MDDDQLIEAWWNTVRTKGSWSGAIHDFAWNELWDHAREDLRTIYRAAIEPGVLIGRSLTAGDLLAIFSGEHAMTATNRRVQIRFDNDEVLTVETAQISLTNPVTGEQTNVPLTNIDTARSAIEQYQKRKNETAVAGGQPNSQENRSPG